MLTYFLKIGQKGFNGLILYQFWWKSGVNRTIGSKDIAKTKKCRSSWPRSFYLSKVSITMHATLSFYHMCYMTLYLWIQPCPSITQAITLAIWSYNPYAETLSFTIGKIGKTLIFNPVVWVRVRLYTNETCLFCGPLCSLPGHIVAYSI